jgi:hypothetical protein
MSTHRSRSKKRPSGPLKGCRDCPVGGSSREPRKPRGFDEHVPIPACGVAGRFRGRPRTERGEPARLFEGVGDLNLEQVRAIEAPGVTHIKYRVVTAARVAQPYRVPPMGCPDRISAMATLVDDLVPDRL